MKKLKYLIVAVLTFFVLEFNVLAVSSNFESTIDMEPDITENRVNVVLGFTGEEVMIVNQTLSYDSSKLKLVEVVPMDNFEVTTSIEKKEGSKYQTLKILADSDYSFNASNYCVAVFEVKSNFKVKNKADVFLYNVEATGPSKEKYRSIGSIMTMNRASKSEMNYLVAKVDNFTSTKYWFSEHTFLIIAIIIGVIGIIVLIFLIPSKRKKEARENKVTEQIKPENYNPNTDTVKIDQQEIEKIGAVEKQIDMSQAIIYNEDVKPFGDIIGKSDVVENFNEMNDFSQNNISVFENRQPEDYATEKVPNELTQVNVSSNNNELKPIMVEEIKDASTTINGFDPFNAQVLIHPQIPANNEAQISVPEIKQIPNAVPQNNQQTSSSDFIELPEKKENLSVINPQSFENVESIEKDIELPKLDEKKTNEIKNSNNSNFMILILFLIVGTIFMNSVLADDGKYNVEELRDFLVGRTSYNKELDYNNDGVVDILDLVVTKNLVNCNFEELINTDPGFKELHGQSNNLISTDPNRVTTTKKSGLFGRKTTTKKLTTEKETTSKRETTKRITTEKVTSASNTEKTTKSTTTRAVASVYPVSITANNGTVSSSSVDLKEGKSTTITLTPNPGYVISQDNISCTNVEFSLSGMSKLVIKNPTAKASCRLNFVPNSKVKIILKVNTGKGNSTLNQPSISYTAKSYDNGGESTYNGTWQMRVALPIGYTLRENPSCGSYSNNYFSIKVPSSNTTCNMYFDPILYTFSVYIPTQSIALNTGTDARIYFGESKQIKFQSSSSFSKITCTGGKSIRLSKNGRGPYNYSFTYKHEKASNAECRIS